MNRRKSCDSPNAARGEQGRPLSRLTATAPLSGEPVRIRRRASPERGGARRSAGGGVQAQTLAASIYGGQGSSIGYAAAGGSRHCWPGKLRWGLRRSGRLSLHPLAAASPVVRLYDIQGASPGERARGEKRLYECFPLCGVSALTSVGAPGEREAERSLPRRAGQAAPTGDTFNPPCGVRMQTSVGAPGEREAKRSLPRRESLQYGITQNSGT